MIDIHSHILPGIDDGARTMADSVEIVGGLARQGVTDVIATPHYIDETIYVSPRDKNLKLLADLKEELRAEGLEINVYLGNEIYIDENILELIQKNKISTLADSNYLLVELPLDDEFPNYQDHLMNLLGNGYKVILAHPERYAIAQKDYQIIEELCEIGVLFQCNLGSIVGRYGRGAKKLLQRLAKDKMIFAFGSDIHRPTTNDYLSLATEKLSKYYSDTELERLFVKNPKKILAEPSSK